MNKICFKCKKEKDIDKFYKHKQMSDGHLGKCIDCTKKDVRERYYSEEGIKKITEYEKKRFKDQKRKKKIAIYRKKRDKKHPNKYKARYDVTNAIRDGRLFREPCEVCGEEKSQAHHDDYRKKLEVRWLCRKHHLEHHGKNSYE